jgi:hypothetical protein
MAPAEFFNAAWIRGVPGLRMRVLRADGERRRGPDVEERIVEERIMEEGAAMSRVLAWRAA